MSPNEEKEYQNTGSPQRHRVTEKKKQWVFPKDSSVTLW
jgi:hypothetical protein